jgi:hypothetical protein
MKRLARIVLTGGLIVAAFILANARNVADAKMAFIRRQGQGYEVTYRYSDSYTLNLYVPPPSRHYTHRYRAPYRRYWAHPYYLPGHYLGYPGYLVPGYYAALPCFGGWYR